ncbi:MAG: hypothetical protein US30_C0004G0079 [Candidatus Moranbacteria bacterium GW2011_GWF2_36_839]|nr:MAG: hypothetical protein US27_C0002G0082 [Candidatus Moranbacteria bacterium GW2011_GWF1_36_78]KKQ17335.1 MAG: hypothetical protein US30_C0004G0079 [Candidatus Moranbacteria bacterium GW2011_GWF2_36_839]HAT73821.1 hypothetical protein [Candidatus Moranbacteria bacterium]HBY11036.1 hypothetical protein [Candidatus Moranbacteria bacterium]
MFEKMRYNFWPLIKTRLIFWWWVLKYRGKKNIPPEVVFEAMTKTMESLKENLQMARICATNSDNVDKKEIEEIYDAINRTDDLEKKINRIQKN